jgi:heat shock protein HtpX
VDGALLSLRNMFKCWLLLVGVCLVFAGLGYLAGGVRLLSILAFCCLLLAAATYWYVDRVALGMLGARELLVGEAPALHSAVERLAALAGMPKPRLYLLADPHPRALATGRGPRRGGGAIAVSSGLLAVCTPAELEGVLAHEVAHIRHRDVLLVTAVAVTAVTIVEASRIGGFLQRALLFVLAPVAAAIVHLLLSPKREFAADRTAARLCDSPHGLADALLRLEQTAELVEFRASPATEPLYTINPFEERGLAALFVTHPPVGERVQRLRRLDPAWREKLRAA